ncbi:MAG TPA: hypothetical protein VFH54_15845 [Mycobacteriales bacterium]|nr:hypothetical protein [Mycobacteriales bacterium]
MSATQLRVTVVAPELCATRGMWGDGSGGWQPKAVAWVSRLAELGVPYDVTDAPTGQPGVVIDAEDLGVDGEDVISLATPASPDDTLQMLAEHLGAVVVPDLRGVLVLRLDDPGAAVKEHLNGWAHPPVTEETWEALWRALDGFGRVSVFCCPGYVRADGRVVDSRDVLPREWAALDAGVRRGVADLECHGFTHMDPEVEAWASADDRLDNAEWFRELWPSRRSREPEVESQQRILSAWQKAIGTTGTAVVAPGERWGLNTLEAARRCGFRLFNSWGLCFLDRVVPTWSAGVGSPYLDEVDGDAIATGLPQVGYWHDRDMALRGAQWVPEQLERWRDAGVHRVHSFAELLSAYEPLDAWLENGNVQLRSAPSGPLRVIRR